MIPTPAWSTQLRARLARALDTTAAPRTQAPAERSLRRVLADDCRNVYLEQVDGWLRYFDIQPGALFGLDQAAPGLSVDLITARSRLRRRLDEAVTADPRGQAAVCAAASDDIGRTIRPSDVTKWRSGEYERLDLYRVRAVLAVCGVDIDPILANLWSHE